jgi:hypothetical protein
VDSISAHELLNDVGHVRQRARGDRRATSVPLIIFGALALVDALLRALAGPIGNIVLLLLAPASFAVIALHYRRREIATGVGSRAQTYAVAAVATVVAFLLFLTVLLLLGMYVVVGVGLLVIALTQGNFYLGVWAVVYGVVGGLEGLSLISNRLYGAANGLGLFRTSDGYFSWSSSLIYGTLGLMLIGAGLYARRREVAST